MSYERIKDRSRQLIQIDTDTGHRLELRRTVTQIRHRDEMVVGSIIIENAPYEVRLIARINEWYICNFDGSRRKIQFESTNKTWSDVLGRWHAKSKGR